MSFNVQFQNSALFFRQIVGIEQSFFQTSSEHDEAEAAEHETLRCISSSLCIKDEHCVGTDRGRLPPGVLAKGSWVGIDSNGNW